MHILNSILHTLMILGGAIALSAGFVAVLVSPIFTGQWLAGRISRRTLAIIGAALAIMCVVGASMGYRDFHNNFAGGFDYVPMVVFFLPLYLGMGLFMGRNQKSQREQNERRLANWQNQLTADRQAGAEPARLSADYRQIAALLNKLGSNSEAVDEYRHAIALLEPSLGNHPGMVEYYNVYLGMLKTKLHADEIARITAKRDALPKL